MKGETGIKRIVVIGGGVSGLAAAYRIAECRQKADLPIELMLLERAGRLGGSIQTIRRDGFLLEAGPDSFITDKPWALALCQRLGIEQDNAECRRARWNVQCLPPSLRHRMGKADGTAPGNAGAG